MNPLDKTLTVKRQGNNANDNIESALENTYSELGKAFYEYRFEEPTPELLPYFDKITQLKSRVEQRSKYLEPMHKEYSSLDELPSHKEYSSLDELPVKSPAPSPSFCPGCGKPIHSSSAFCGYCGHKLS